MGKETWLWSRSHLQWSEDKSSDTSNRGGMNAWTSAVWNVRDANHSLARTHQQDVFIIKTLSFDLWTIFTSLDSEQKRTIAPHLFAWRYDFYFCMVHCICNFTQTSKCCHSRRKAREDKIGGKHLQLSAAGRACAEGVTRETVNL